MHTVTPHILTWQRAKQVCKAIEPDGRSNLGRIFNSKENNLAAQAETTSSRALWPAGKRDAYPKGSSKVDTLSLVAKYFKRCGDQDCNWSWDIMSGLWPAHERWTRDSYRNWENNTPNEKGIQKK